MAWVVSDSSTLIHLSAIERLSLLQDFFGRVLVPPAVWREVVEEGADRPGSAHVAQARQDGWIEVSSPESEFLLRSLKQDLDDGEAEAIALAIEVKASLILLDESEARRAAGVFGLAMTGVIGVLIRARAEGKLTSLREELDRLRNEAGFWIQERVYRKALSAVGEDSLG